MKVVTKRITVVAINEILNHLLQTNTILTSFIL